MKNLMIKFLMANFCLLLTAGLIAQEADSMPESEEMEKESPLSISGSVDLYYKADFAGSAASAANISGGENYTFFAPDNNSFSIGMANLILEKSLGKSSFVADLSFGPRGGSSSILTQNESDGSFHIQNLYVSHAFTDGITLSAGFMGTFVGYEVISPAANFNYSTSHLFSWGPFQNAGVKLDFALSDKFGLMVGLFNDWNAYTDLTSKKDIGAQLSYSIADGNDIFLNFITGASSGTEIDLTAGFQLTDKFFLGVNAATYSVPDEEKLFSTGSSGFSGVALYPQVSITDNFALGLRAEYFSEKEINDIFAGSYTEAASVFSTTLTANITAGAITFIPEFRFDNGSQDIYIDSDGNATGGAAQFLIAAVYGF
ncbi:MAG: porin [Saprospiraceae bacterium]|nr:porin [Saprospiraceae bacterium]